MERVTADSNIWISGLNWRGKPHELLNLARDGKIELAVSDLILDEVNRILHDKFEWSVDRLSALRTEIATFTNTFPQTKPSTLFRATTMTIESSSAPSPLAPMSWSRATRTY